MEEYKAEFNAYQRLGGVIETNFKTDDYDLTHRFYMFVSIVSNNAEDAGIISGVKNGNLNKDVLKIKEPRYKNPTAVVLGYYVSSEGVALDKKKLSRINSKLDHLDYPVLLEDVVRYARMWMSLTQSLY
ncbi:hypothetical protein LCDVSa180R [Lymphocystis disease virus 3]|uniref:Uncharacterized protein n=1 Tax=Lymphocystis disease virus 3 TaxID=2560566 RepID=A0A1B2RW82_9VIRU|nr:hypothetical protein BZK12_gp180 [Lymphocystis disease virus Sa]AOC55264.1 hypothetical protein LCDVSa180R [Lymphocystis disease virus 3]